MCIIRWGTWISAAVYYAEHFEKIVEIVNGLEEDAASIRFCKEILQKENICSDLSFIHAHFSSMPVSIKLLEERNLTITEQFNILDDAVAKLMCAPGLKGEFIKEKCEKVFSSNKGLHKLREINELLCGNNIHTNMSPIELGRFKYAPCTSVDVERTFSIFKHILSDKRQNLKFENLKKLLVVAANQFVDG